MAGKNITFEILDAIFKDKNKINNITKQTAKDSVFEINRIISKKYPEQAQLFNIKAINPLNVIKSWNDFLQFGYTPAWVYAKGDASIMGKKESNTFKKDILYMYMDMMELTKRDMEDMFKFFPAEMNNELKEFEKFITNKTDKDE